MGGRHSPFEFNSVRRFEAQPAWEPANLINSQVYLIEKIPPIRFLLLLEGKRGGDNGDHARRTERIPRRLSGMTGGDALPGPRR